jgi:hypothetical protein
LGVDRDPVLAELTAAGPVLVHFFDFAQLNSVRSLPYVVAWERRYRDAGLATLGVHSPRFGFTGRRDALQPALERLGIAHPVADDSDYAVWHDYGCKGWPSLFLWGQGGALRWFHFGEGEYAETERAIARELAAVDPEFKPPAPLAPLRPTDAPDALVAQPSEEILPGGSVSEPWPGEGGERTLDFEYSGGGAHVSADGEGELRVTLDGGVTRTVAVTAPGLYDLAVHPQHESHAMRLEAGAGVDLYSLSFSAALP